MICGLLCRTFSGCLDTCQLLQWPQLLNKGLKEVDPELYDIIEHEKNRQYKVRTVYPAAVDMDAPEAHHLSSAQVQEMQHCITSVPHSVLGAPSSFSCFVPTPCEVMNKRPGSLAMIDCGCGCHRGFQSESSVHAGSGAHSLRELRVNICHGGGWLSHDQQVFRGLPRRSLLWWQRVHRPGRAALPGARSCSVWP